MAYDQSIVSQRRKLSYCAVGDRDIVQCDTGFEGEGWYYGDCLVGNEAGERILELRLNSCCQNC